MTYKEKLLVYGLPLFNMCVIIFIFINKKFIMIEIRLVWAIILCFGIVVLGSWLGFTIGSALSEIKKVYEKVDAGLLSQAPNYTNFLVGDIVVHKRSLQIGKIVEINGDNIKMSISDNCFLNTISSNLRLATMEETVKFYKEE